MYTSEWKPSADEPSVLLTRTTDRIDLIGILRNQLQLLSLMRDHLIF